MHRLSLTFPTVRAAKPLHRSYFPRYSPIVQVWGLQLCSMVTEVRPVEVCAAGYPELCWAGEEVSEFLSRHFPPRNPDPDLTDEVILPRLRSMASHHAPQGLIKHFLEIDQAMRTPEGSEEVAKCVRGRKNRPATFRVRMPRPTARG